MTRGGLDTIAAIATAPGRAALAVVRISGPEAETIARVLLPNPATLAARRASLRTAVDPASRQPLDRVLATFFPGPGSYTGEDMLELSCHGGTAASALILDAACAAGARPAERGEFTRRAYLNGRLDLVQAEATLDLIEARSAQMSRAALFALERGLSRRVEQLREGIIGTEALIAYDIDFPEEDDGPVDRGQVEAKVAALVADIEALLEHAPEGELLREGALTVVAGRPNAGKSSLFNALLGTERAIVTEVPGTTRDAIEALLSIEGYPFRLVDTAGIRNDADRIEGMGIEVARAYLERADLVIVCVEGDREPGAEEKSFVDGLDERLGVERVLVVRTKIDLSRGRAAASPVREPGPRGPAHGTEELAVSVLEATGLGDVRKAMLAAVYAGISGRDEAPLVTHRRHVRALEAARDSLHSFQREWADGQPSEIAATYLQSATLALEGLLGVVSNDDVLDALFSGFCVGK